MGFLSQLDRTQSKHCSLALPLRDSMFPTIRPYDALLTFWRDSRMVSLPETLLVFETAEVVLYSCDSEEFRIPETVASRSQTVRNMLEDTGPDDAGKFPFTRFTAYARSFPS